MKFLKLLKNRYIIVLVVMFSYVAFFDVYSLGVQFRMQQQLSHLKQEIKRYQQEYSADSSAYENLLHDKESIETYVREHLYMKKANEDIFLIEELTPEDLPNP